MKLGIDFGTAFSTMAYSNPVTGRPEVISDDSGLTKIPTIVYLGPEDEIKVGQAALDLLNDTELMDPDLQFETRSRIIKSVKMMIGEDIVIPLPDGSTVTPGYVVSRVLGYLKGQAEKRISHGQPFDELTLTHPSSFTQAQKQILVEAAQNAGFKQIELLEEPIAAALGYAHSNVDTGNNILVYDLGGGTLDLAFVERDEDGEYRLPVPTVGDPACGGDNFDAALYDHFEKKLPNGQHFKDNPDEFDLKVLLDCRMLKETLSRREQAGIRIWTDKVRLQETISRHDFENLILPLINGSIDLLERLLGQIKEVGYEVNTLIMIGGSSRIPLIRNLLTERLQITPLETSQDDVAVALGAAVDLAEVRRKRDEQRRQAAEAERLRIAQEKQEAKEREQLARQQELDNQRKEFELRQQNLEQNFEERQQTLVQEFQEKQELASVENMKKAQSAFKRKEYGEAIHRYRDAAEQGNAEAQFKMGDIYEHGIGVQSNLQTAIKWYSKAAEQDYQPVIFPLAMAFIRSNKAAASIPWLEKAHENNDLRATFELGYSYKEGRGVPVDNDKASDLLLKVAESENCDSSLKGNACYHYALMCSERRALHCKKFQEGAQIWMKKAADLGHIRATAWLASKATFEAVKGAGKYMIVQGLRKFFK